MQRVDLLGVLAVATVLFSSTPLLAVAPTPSFTITATNVTLTSRTASGVGSSSFTLTSVNGYTGTVRIACNLPTPQIGVTMPYCGYGTAETAAVIPAPPSITLTANQVVTGTIPFFNSSVPSCTNVCPASLQPRPKHRLAQGLALAGALLFGSGFRRRGARWLTLTLFAVSALAGLAGISACGGSNSVVTPGTYVYTISATDISTAVSVTTSINVTVP